MNTQQAEKCRPQPGNSQPKPETEPTPTSATGENQGKDVSAFVQVLTPVEQQVLKDTLLHGCWGDGEYEFLVENRKDCHLIETAPMMGYCTNDAQRGGHAEFWLLHGEIHRAAEEASLHRGVPEHLQEDVSCRKKPSRLCAFPCQRLVG